LHNLIPFFVFKTIHLVIEPVDFVCREVRECGRI